MDLLTVLLIGSLLIGGRVGLHFLDKRRIENYCLTRGMKIRTIEWQPLHNVFENRERHYQITYSKGGASFRAIAKTGLLTGVFLGEEVQV
jgi:hypothetical protein